MYCIVPLAGPDFYQPHYGVKALSVIDGEPLIKRALGSRSWFRNGELINEDIFFVLRDLPQTQDVIHALMSIFPGCKTVLIPELTRGAVLSSLAAISLISDFNRPIVVDLVDILYESNIVVREMFLDESIGGFLPYFKSGNEKYSYLVFKNGSVVQTAEKRVISDCASAGTYFFRNLSVLLAAYSDSVANSQIYAVKGNLFLCPTFNGIIKQGLKVHGVEVSKVQEISIQFHSRNH